jgi:HNH endonuclease
VSGLRPDPWGRFWSAVDVGAFLDCWNWTGATRRGYGIGTSMNGHRASAHVQSFLLHYGPYQRGLHIAHRCGNRRCVNPLHLYAATPGENERDKVTHGTSRANRTHCVNGHERTDDNTYTRPDGRGKQCKVCGLERRRAS